MSVFKPQFSRAIKAYKSDNADIANPSTYISTGTTTTLITSLLIDSAGLFITNNVKTGDVIYNDTLSSSATVVSVSNETTILLNAHIFTATGQNYTIYAMSAQTSMGNPGFFLYVGGTGNVSVITIGGDQIIFNAVPAGTTLPIQVARLRLTSTTATNVLGLF